MNNTIADAPGADMLNGVRPLYHYYDVHVSYGNDEGASIFIETTIAPPEGTEFSENVPDPVRQQVIDYAVQTEKLVAAEASDVDYVALMDAEEWSAFNTRHESKPAAVVNALLEEEPVASAGPDPDDPQHNLDRYAQAIGTAHAKNDRAVLDRFKRGAKAYIRWAHTDPEMGQMYDETDLRRISRATTFAQVQAVLANYETTPSFLSMVAQGYFT